MGKKLREEGKREMVENLLGHTKEFQHNSVGNKNILEDFSQGYIMSIFAFFIFGVVFLCKHFSMYFIK